MRWVLDTSACVDLLRGVPGAAARVQGRSPAEFALSTMTLAELWHGAARSAFPDQVRRTIDAFTSPFELLPFDEAAAAAHAATRHALERAGTPIGERDLIIAATALANELGVITGNFREFARVPGLVIERWDDPPPRGAKRSRS